MTAPTTPDLDLLLRLARLSATPERRAELRDRLQAMLTAFAQIGAVDTRGVAAADLPAAQAPRPDDAAPQALTNAEALANAPRALDGCFAVPRVVEG
ncbi:MAG: Asp-tRNA(Asn)/Glu-tRNA(Gln) amidotransferase subunit GatC [Planctomycetota bacterium]